MKKVIIEIRVTEHQKEKVQYLAWSNYEKVSEYIRRILKNEEVNIDEESFNKWKAERDETN